MPQQPKTSGKLNPRYAWLGLVLLTLVLIIGLVGWAEKKSRLQDWPPGYLRPLDELHPFQELNAPHELEVDTQFVMADSLGGQQYSNAFARSIRLKLLQLNGESIYSKTQKEQNYGIPDYQFRRLVHFGQRLQGAAAEPQTAQNPFEHYFSAQLRDQPEQDWTHSLRSWAEAPVNAQGYFSPDFYAPSPERKRILLLGDSFTFGQHAEPLTAAFAQLLQSPAYAVFNTALPSTNPAHYLAAARRWAPIVQPDAVVVCAYYGNDILWFDEPAAPYLLANYPTASGWFNAYRTGYRFPNAWEAYRYSKSEVSIQGRKQPGLWKLAPYSSLWTRVLVTLTNQGVLDLPPRDTSQFQEVYVFQNVAMQRPPAGGCYLQRIVDYCDSLGVPVLVCTIPTSSMVADSATWKRLSPHLYLSRGRLHQPVGLLPRHYHQLGVDQHFNNAGHSWYANWLRGKLDSLFLAPAATPARGTVPGPG